MKKFFILIFIILLFFSVYHDFTKQNNIKNDHLLQNDNKYVNLMYIKLENGETILSILEKINGQDLYKRSISELHQDFSTVNQIDYNDVKQNHYYYFQIYKK